MTAFTIPETIIPGALYVPGANNYFDINPTGMPDGQPSLIVRGDVNRNYKAFQRAPLVTPNLFRERRTAAVWSMAFWVKAGNISAGVAGHHSDQVMFGSMSYLAGNGRSPAGVITHRPGLMPEDGGSLGSIPGMEWVVCAVGNGGSNCQIGFIRQQAYVANFSEAGQGIHITFTLTPGAWHQIVINVPDATSTNIPTGFNNGTPVNGTYSNVGAGGPNDLGHTGNAYFCIGSYSDTVNFNGRDGEWELGKLSFHSRHLTQLESDGLGDVGGP